MKLYLAHPFTMRHEIREWEVGFERRTGIDLINPFYDPIREDIRKIDAGMLVPRSMKHKEDGMKIVDTDLLKIEKAGGLLAFISKDKESMGTPMELFYCSKILGFPAYVITKDFSGHPWIRGLATEVFQTKEEFEEYIGRRE